MAVSSELADALADFSEFIYFPSIVWNHSWERQQTLISHFCASHGDRQGLVVAPTGLINHAPWRFETWKKIAMGRLTKTHADATASHIENPTPHNLIYLKARIGRGTSNLFAALTVAFNYDLRVARKKRGRRLVFASYVNPLVEQFLRTADFSILDLAERRQANPSLTEYMRSIERRWAAQVNLLVTDNEAALSDYADDRRRAGLQPGYIIPQGFQPPVELARKSGSKTAAYLGNLHSAIDYEYLEELINRNPDWNFKLCGQIMEPDSYKILSLPNVRYHGVISNDQISCFLNDASVGLIPYLRNDWTAGVFPTKLFEYLGHEVPVLSTSIPEVVRFADPRFVQISDRPIKLNPPFLVKSELNEFITPHTWDGRISSYAQAIVRSRRSDGGQE